MSNFYGNDDLTIMNLFYFFKNRNEYDEHLIENFIRQLDNGDFWLGGHLKLSHDDYVNLKLIQRVKEMRQKRLEEYGPPCNSLEMMSVYTSAKQLDLIESMVIKYNQLNFQV